MGKNGDGIDLLLGVRGRLGQVLDDVFGGRTAAVIDDNIVRLDSGLHQLLMIRQAAVYNNRIHAGGKQQPWLKRLKMYAGFQWKIPFMGQL